LKGEHCFLTTHEEDNIECIEKQMVDNGIDIEAYNKRSSCIFIRFQIIWIIHPEEELIGVDGIMNRILANSKPPYHIEGKAISEINRKEQTASNIDIEYNNFHSNFHKLLGSILYQLAYIF
jgi:hypothetical protein